KYTKPRFDYVSFKFIRASPSQNFTTFPVSAPNQDSNTHLPEYSHLLKKQLHLFYKTKPEQGKISHSLILCSTSQPAPTLEPIIKHFLLSLKNSSLFLPFCVTMLFKELSCQY